ncbi:hypothetical protein TNCV_4798431 [Trichonephila clavipes]|nr:hypothetical protein TNCV_4798431 [Trichonephila clavipes]
MARVRTSNEKSVKRSENKHVAVLRLSDRNFRRIEHQDLLINPYKRMLTYELSAVTYGTTFSLGRTRMPLARQLLD